MSEYTDVKGSPTRMCLATSPDGLRACAYAPGHEGPHGWERDTEALLATVRKGLPPDIRGLGATGSLDGTDPMQVGRDAWDALDSLAAELELMSQEIDHRDGEILAAEAELERLRESVDPHMLQAAVVQVERAEAAEAELERVKAERDENMAEALRWAERCNKALAALRVILELRTGSPQIRARARTAIADIEGEA